MVKQMNEMNAKIDTLFEMVANLTKLMQTSVSATDNIQETDIH